MENNNKTFKEKWNEEDRRCPYCNQVTERSRGLTRQNIRRLVFSKPTTQDLIMLAVIILVLLIAWRYQVETQQCRDIMNNGYTITNDMYFNPNIDMEDLNFSLGELNKSNNFLQNGTRT
ncbi:MAG: hypothetical protein ACP5D2_03465 [Candidatus Nanoarchaeia archaeon]